MSEHNSRRTFLKHAAVAAAGFSIVPRHVLGGTGFVAPSDKLQCSRYWGWGKGKRYQSLR